MKIVDYHIVQSLGFTELTEQVKRWIKQGYEPQGGLAINSKDVYFQSVVKKEEENVKEEAITS